VSTQTFSNLTNSEEISGNRMKYGGDLIQVLNSYLKVDNCKFYPADDMLFNHKGISLSYSILNLSNSEFGYGGSFLPYKNPQDMYSDLISVGGAVYVGEDSLLLSRANKFKHNSAVYGGCVGIESNSRAFFEGDEFEDCIASLGGAIYAVDFNSFLLNDTSFINNRAFGGYGEAIYASNFG